MSDLSRLSRLTSILLILQSKRLITATSLAEKFDISIRTVYRDIRALEAAGLPIVTEEGKGYSLLEGYRLPPVMFTEEEANALVTAEKLIAKNKEGSLIANYQSAITKIKAVLNFGAKEKADLLENRIVYFKNFDNRVTSKFLSTIQIAITNYKLLKIKYQRISDLAISVRQIEPLALYNAQDNWILIAWCRLRQDYREFRLDRIQTMEILEDNFEKRNFDMAKYFATTLEKLKARK